MKQPNEMTNAELAEHMVALNTRSATIEAAKRLRAMPEPDKPEIYYRAVECRIGLWLTARDVKIVHAQTTGETKMKWNEIMAEDIDWSQNPISKRAGHAIRYMSNKSEFEINKNKSEFWPGAWFEFSLGDIAARGPKHWGRCIGIGDMGVEVIKWIIDQAAIGECPMKPESGFPAHDAYIPKSEMGI